MLEGSGFNTQDVAITDVQGDARNELIASVTTPARIVVMERQPNGSYVEVDAIAVDGGVGAIAVGDVDLDGDADLAASSAVNGLLLFFQDAEGLGPPQDVDAGEDPSQAIRIADVHAGGWAEIVTGGRFEEPWPHPGLDLIELVDGTWERFEIHRVVAADVEIADLDIDGRPDLVAASGTVVRVYHQETDGTFDPSSLSSLFPVQGVGLGDVNGDGITDVVTNELGVMLGEGDGTFADEAPLGWDSTSGIAVGDVNGDGLDDIVNRGSTWFQVFVQGPDGLQDPCFWRDPSEMDGRPDGDVIGDVTGDGAVDLVAADGGFNAVVSWERSTSAPTTISVSLIDGSTAGFGQQVRVAGTLTPWETCPASNFAGEDMELLVDGNPVKTFEVGAEGHFGGAFVPQALGEIALTARWQGDGLHAATTQDVGSLTVVPGKKYLRVRAPKYVGLGKNIKIVATLSPHQIATDTTVTITALIPGRAPKVLVTDEVDAETGTLSAEIPKATRTRVIRASWAGGDGFDPIAAKATTQVGSRTSTAVRGHHAKQDAYYVFRRGVPALYLIGVAPNHSGDPVTVELQRFDGVWHRIATDRFRLREGSRVGILVSPRLLHAGERYRIFAEFNGDQLNGGSTSRWSYLKVG